MQLERHIAHLLKHHNCVIVPEFGGFIANYESAWINRSRALIFPPYKQILFNGNLTQNDGLLANELVLKESLLYNEALTKIAVQVKDWRQQLDAGSRIELDEIGFLFVQNNQIVFEQNREVNLLLQAYGLKQVSFINYSSAKPVDKNEVTATPVVERPVLKILEKDRSKIHQEAEEPKKEIPVIALNPEEDIEQVAQPSHDDPKVIAITGEKKKSRNYKYAVAAAVVLPVLFYSYWIPMKTNFLDSGKIHLSDLNPFNERVAAVYQERSSSFNLDLTTDWKSWEELTAGLPENVAVYNYELNDETYVAVRVNEDAGLNSVGTLDATGAYNLIAGCFSVESNAVNFVAELNRKGYPAAIVDKNKGLYRVSAGSFSTVKEAEAALDKFKTDGFSGWILKP